MSDFGYVLYFYGSILVIVDRSICCGIVRGVWNVGLDRFLLLLDGLGLLNFMQAVCGIRWRCFNSLWKQIYEIFFLWSVCLLAIIYIIYPEWNGILWWYVKIGFSWVLCFWFALGCSLRSKSVWMFRQIVLLSVLMLILDMWKLEVILGRPYDTAILRKRWFDVSKGENCICYPISCVFGCSFTCEIKRKRDWASSHAFFTYCQSFEFMSWG